MVSAHWLGAVQDAVQGEGLAPAGDAPWTEFFVALGITVVLLSVVVWSGKTRRRKTHYAFVAAALVGLTFAILYAERVGKYWSFPALPLRIHLSLAYSATVGTLLASISGLLHVFGKLTRKAHARWAWLALLLIVLATCTGVWIFAVGAPKA